MQVAAFYRRFSSIQDQLQDLSDMHRREMSDLKQEFVALEEKLEYHAHERARDFQVSTYSCWWRENLLLQFGERFKLFNFYVLVLIM